MTAINPRFSESRGMVRVSEFIGAGHVKGTILAAHVQWVRDNRTPVEYVKFWDALPREVRTAIGMVLPVKWYDFAHLIAIDRAIVDLFGHGSSAVLRDLGTYSARMNLGGAYKSFTRTSIHDFFASAARLHVQFQDFGELAYSARAANSGTIVHRNYTSYSPLYCESAAGYYQEAVTLHGGTNVMITEPECQCRGDKACVFVIRWS